MSIIEINSLSFTYAGATKPAVSNVSLNINSGEITLVAGRSGSGKSTLLSLLKPEIRGEGQMRGSILLEGKVMPSITTRETVASIGYMNQNPEAQIVTDKVYRELTYGLENLGLSPEEIMSRCAEISAFLGISHLFRKNTWELSGGQKQVINLASLLVMEPKVLLLDEPTSRLDPVSAEEFLYMLQRVKNEFGTAVLLAEHDWDKVVHLSDKMCLMESGELTAVGTPRQVMQQLKQGENGTTAWRLWKGSGEKGSCPLGLNETMDYVKNVLPRSAKEHTPVCLSGEVVLKCKDLWYRHTKSQDYVLRGIDLSLKKGEFQCIMGANGSGKSSLLRAISQGEKGIVIARGNRVGKLPQDVTELFLHSTVRETLEHVLEIMDIRGEERQETIDVISRDLDIAHLLDKNPLKISGGEQKRVALAKVLLARPHILLLDEPTGSLDAKGRQDLIKVIRAMKDRGVGILAVTHDTEFVTECDTVSVLFDGKVSVAQEPHEFLCGNRFFTTRTASICRGWIDGVITTKEALGE